MISSSDKAGDMPNDEDPNQYAILSIRYNEAKGIPQGSRWIPTLQRTS